uniref:ZP domain-containing protein n=1 Tax=Plectus sambesii TaxID=2011161 RepID=A0A914VDY6_9BILA
MVLSPTFLLLCSSVVSVIFAIPIDNRAIGVPEVQCDGDSLLINYNTDKPWDGVFFVKNHHSEAPCVVRGNDSRKLASLHLRFDQCGVSRRRSCFYMEADKTVSQELEVSMLTTALATLTVPMPVCRYEILENTENGQPVRLAVVGMQVFHKWACDSDTADTFCMTVVNCIVSDGANDNIQLLDDQGCALDKFILGNIEYPTDLMAGKEAHVFKYADRANLYFNCQTTISIKEPGQECKRPNCPELTRRRRSETQQARGHRVSDLITDVAPPSILVADIDMNENDIESGLRHAAAVHVHERAADVEQRDFRGLCFSASGFFLLLTVVGALFTGWCVLIYMLK